MVLLQKSSRSWIGDWLGYDASIDFAKGSFSQTVFNNDLCETMKFLLEAQ